MDKIIFGARIHEARRKADLSSNKLAELCDCAPTSIRAIESGARLPSVPKLVDLCNMLKVSPNELLGQELTFPVGEYDELSIKDAQKLIIRIQMLPKGKKDLVLTVLETIISQIERL